jgi:hypothetical protein
MCLTRRKDNVSGVFDTDSQCAFEGRLSECFNKPGYLMMVCPVTCNNTKFNYHSDSQSVNCNSLSCHDIETIKQCP